MGLFDAFRKRDDVLDLTTKRSGEIPIPKRMQSSPTSASSSDDSSGLGFVGSLAGGASVETSSSYSELSSSDSDVKDRLSKRLIDMTGRMEDLSNQIYRMQQRIELLEQKLSVRRN